jgi:hypothetical protein
MYNVAHAHTLRLNANTPAFVALASVHVAATRARLFGPLQLAPAAGASTGDECSGDHVTQ